MSSPILPQELVENIIDHLHDDPATLRSCALVSSAWLPASRYHIFHHVSIRLGQGAYLENTPCGGEASRLYQIVVSSPEIVPYICDLLIYKGVESPDPYLNRMTQKESLPLLRLLTNLRRLEFKNYDRRLEELELVPRLIDSIFTASCLPSIVELRLFGLCFENREQLLRVFRLFPALKVLHLEKILLVEEEAGEVDYFTYRYDEAEGGSDLVTTQRVRLDVLSIASSHSPAIIKILLHPRSFIDVTHICQLNLAVRPAWLPNLLRSTPYLEHLRFDFGYAVVLYPRFVASKFPDIGHHPFLRSLDLRFGIMVDTFRLPSWLPALLNVRSPNCLEEISLMVTVSTYQSEYVEPPSWWRDIDSLLTRPQFSRLRRVRLGFAPSPGADDRVMPLIVHDILARLPNLDNRGILFVDDSLEAMDNVWSTDIVVHVWTDEDCI